MPPLTDLLGHCYGARNLEAFRHEVVEGLFRLVPSHSVFDNEINPVKQRLVPLIQPRGVIVLHPDGRVRLETARRSGVAGRVLRRPSERLPPVGHTRAMGDAAVRPPG